MIKHLFLLNLKQNKILIISFTLILSMYSTIATGMFDPESAEAMNEMLKMIPNGMAKALGFENFGTEITIYLANYLYGFIYFIFPMIFIIMIANKLMSKHIDSGSMVYILTTPHKRVKIALTQAIFLVLSILFIIFINVGIIILISEAMFPGAIKISTFIVLNLVTFSALLFISSIAYLTSCYFNDKSYSLGISSGIAVWFFVANALKNLNDNLEFLKYTTVFSIVNIDKIFNSEIYGLIMTLIFTILSIIIYLVSIIIFDKKSLTI